MTRYAEVEEIQDGWRPLSVTETVWAEQLLDAAGEWITDKVVPIEPKLAAAKFVSIDVVRSAIVPLAQQGLVNFSKAIGPWSKSGTLVNPSGQLTFSDFHKELLGIKSIAVPLYTFKENDY